MLTEWNLSYEEWMIGDGQPHRHFGETFEWLAVEFWSLEPLNKSDEQPRSAVAVPNFKYKVIAEVTFLSEKSCVIDFGLRAISTSDRISPPCKVGDYVAGEISLGVPLCIDIVPDQVLNALRHKWKVNGISADLTPFVASPDNPRYFTRDDSRIQYQNVPSTECVQANNYILHCTEVLPFDQ